MKRRMYARGDRTVTNVTQAIGAGQALRSGHSYLTQVCDEGRQS